MLFVLMTLILLGYKRAHLKVDPSLKDFFGGILEDPQVRYQSTRILEDPG